MALLAVRKVEAKVSGCVRLGAKTTGLVDHAGQCLYCGVYGAAVRAGWRPRWAMANQLQPDKRSVLQLSLRPTRFSVPTMLIHLA